MMALSASKGWKIRSMDIKTAFLQGKYLDREIFLKPPREAGTKQLCKLRKCVYGLKDASRYWYLTVSQKLIDAGMQKSKYDDALFYYKRNGKLVGLLSLHVDDFLSAGSQEFGDDLSHIRKNFVVGSEADTPFKYLGLDISYDNSYVMFSQQSYINGISEYVIENKGNRQRILDSKEQRSFRALCGQLNWISSQSRPDIAFDVCQLSTKLNKATAEDFLYANKVVRKVKSQSITLKFGCLQPPLKLSAFCDASFANLKDGGSQGGVIIFITDQHNNASPIYWTSRKMRRVCRSTISAETMALLEATETSFWLASIINELLDSPIKSTEIHIDNLSLFEAANSTTAVEEKRLRVDLASLRESIVKKEFHLKWLEGGHQLADVLTKQGADSKKLIQALTTGKI